MSSIDEQASRDLVASLIRRGDFVFFLDGYDEVPESEREHVNDHLSDFISKAGSNHFVITSRPELSVSSFGSFQRFSIKPLSRDEAFELIRKCDPEDEIATHLIEELQGEAFSEAEELLSNPLLVSLLFTSYSYKNTVPLQRDIFYRQVFDALFEAHDLTKTYFRRDKRSGLNVEQFHGVLRALGYNTYREDELEFSKHELLQQIEKAQELSAQSQFSVSDFLDDLLVAVPLFVRDGNYFKWAHKSFQEYFAACFIGKDAKGKQDAILGRMYYAPGRHMSVLDFCHDLDPKAFRRAVTRKVAKAYIDYCQVTYRGISHTTASDEELQHRRMLSFGREYTLLFLKKHDGRIVREIPYEMPLDQRYETSYSRREVTISDQIQVFVSYTAPGLITRMLARKHSPICVDGLNKTLPLPQFLFFEDVKPPSGKFKIMVFTRVDDTFSNPANTPGWFQAVNAIMAHVDPSGIDISACEKLIRTLEQEKRDDENNDLLDGL